MRKFNFKNFNKTLSKDFVFAFNAMSEIENYNWDLMNGYTPPPHVEGEVELNKERFVDRLLSIEAKILFAYEYLGLTNMYEMISAQLDEYDENYDQLDFLSYIDVFESPVLSILDKHFKAIISQLDTNDVEEQNDLKNMMLLERMLRSTGKMLSDREIEPSNEAIVRNEVYKTLTLVFPDTVREMSISKVTKTFKPDIGIKSLKCAIEYKFSDSKEEIKTAIGGIFEDMKGYEGSLDWTKFYAVFYITDNFITQDQIEAEFKLSKVPINWKPIVVFGKGRRIK